MEELWQLLLLSFWHIEEVSWLYSDYFYLYVGPRIFYSYEDSDSTISCCDDRSCSGREYDEFFAKRRRKIFRRRSIPERKSCSCKKFSISLSGWNEGIGWFGFKFGSRKIDCDCRTFRLWKVYFRFFVRSEEHTSELQSRQYLVCRLLL